MTGKTELRQYYLVRWDMSQPATILNTVVMCKESYDQHLTYKTIGEAPYATAMQPIFQEKLQLIGQYRQAKHVNYR